MASHVELVKRCYDAFSRGDMEAFLALMAPDVEWTEPKDLPYGGTYHGHRGLREVAAQWSEVYSDMTVDPLEYHESGEVVIVIGQYRFTTRTGDPLLADFVHVWDVGRGAVRRYRDFTDKAGKLEKALRKAQAGA